MRHTHLPLTIALCAILSLMPEHAHGQGHEATTTTTVSLSGIVNCQEISLVATRLQRPNLLDETSVDFGVRECDPGQTVPSRVVAFFRSVIHNADLTTDHVGAKLLTTSPYGPMQVTWTLTADRRSTYDAQWKWFAPDNVKQTQHDEFRSVVATGSIGSFVIGQRLGTFVTSVLSRRE